MRVHTCFPKWLDKWESDSWRFFWNTLFGPLANLVFSFCRMWISDCDENLSKISWKGWWLCSWLENKELWKLCIHSPVKNRNLVMRRIYEPVPTSEELLLWEKLILIDADIACWPSKMKKVHWTTWRHLKTFSKVNAS